MPTCLSSCISFMQVLVFRAVEKKGIQRKESTSASPHPHPARTHDSIERPSNGACSKHAEKAWVFFFLRASTSWQSLTEQKKKKAKQKGHRSFKCLCCCCLLLTNHSRSSRSPRAFYCHYQYRTATSRGIYLPGPVILDL